MLHFKAIKWVWNFRMKSSKRAYTPINGKMGWDFEGFWGGLVTFCGSSGFGNIATLSESIAKQSDSIATPSEAIVAPFEPIANQTDPIAK